jgi:hypothetical protein
MTGGKIINLVTAAIDLPGRPVGARELLDRELARALLERTAEIAADAERRTIRQAHRHAD